MSGGAIWERELRCCAEHRNLLSAGHVRLTTRALCDMCRVRSGNPPGGVATARYGPVVLAGVLAIVGILLLIVAVLG